MGILAFLAVLSILIFIHELGHYTIARYFGVKVEVFSIGFGKKIYSKSYKGTLWTISLLPFGGYVKLKGQEDLNPINANYDIDSYNSKTSLQRIFILLGGPLFNILLASVLYFGVAMIGNTVISPTIGKIMPNSSAFQAGLKVDDKIVRINENTIKRWKDIGINIATSNGNLKLHIIRDGKSIIKYLKTKNTDSTNIYNEKIKKQMIGIAPKAEFFTMHYTFFESIRFMIDETISGSTMIFTSVQKLITGAIPSSEIGGIVSIGSVISQASQTSLIATMLIAALISINLAILNLLPIPALDGGHIMFNLYELITKKKVNEKIMINLTILGWILLLGLMVLGLYNDIVRLLN